MNRRIGARAMQGRLERPASSDSKSKLSKRVVAGVYGAEVCALQKTGVGN